MFNFIRTNFNVEIDYNIDYPSDSMLIGSCWRDARHRVSGCCLAASEGSRVVLPKTRRPVTKYPTELESSKGGRILQSHTKAGVVPAAAGGGDVWTKLAPLSLPPSLVAIQIYTKTLDT